MQEPRFDCLKAMLEGKLFKVPEFQRHYSWETEHRKALFQDIQKLRDQQKKDSGRIHFMATIVCLKKQIEPENVNANIFRYYDIIDGQQRMTTLIILLKAISLNLKGYNQDDLKGAYESVDRLVVKDNNRAIILLENNHDNYQILKDYLQDGKKPNPADFVTQADKNLGKAITECGSFVAEWGSAKEVEALLTLVQNFLHFIFYQVDDEGAVYTIFESLNSRGLEVDCLDKCKSSLMGLLYEYTDKKSEAFKEGIGRLHNLWTRIYKDIGQQTIPGHEIVRFAATLKVGNGAGRPLSEKEALEFFIEDCTKNLDSYETIKRIEDNTIWLKDVTSCLADLYSEKKIKAISDVTQARLLRLAIMLRTNLQNDEKNKLLEQWERTTFKIYGLMGKDSRKKVGDYVRLAKKIQKNQDLAFDDLLHEIAKIGEDISIQEAARQLSGKDFYEGWQDELRYFFCCYEEHLNKDCQLALPEWTEIWNSDPNDSIEHILPQNKGRDCWGHVSAAEHKELLHSIGNLCLIAPHLNKRCGDKCFKDKLPIYGQSSLESLKEVTLNGRRVEWDKSSIEHRTEELIRFTTERWKDL